MGRSLGPDSHEMRVAPEATRTIIGSGGMPAEGTRPLRESEVPPERTRLMPLDDSGSSGGDD